MMEKSLQTPVNRRSFLAAGGMSVAAAALFKPASGLAQSKLRVAIVGTGSRGSSTWGRSVVDRYSDVVEIVGLCDINGKRVLAARDLIGTRAPTYVDFNEMIAQTRPDSVVVTTIDATHYKYIMRAMELGCDVITEKPMCTDEDQCQAILDSQKKYARQVTVTFNLRHGRGEQKPKTLLLEKAIGDIISVDFHEFLNTSHGADYFRRWHRLKENSGTLLVHKASHHFDLVNWWLDSEPVEVTARGDLKFYGRNNSFRSTHCRVCPYQERCQFHWNITKNPRYVKLYVDCESEDGYLRDGCLWQENTNIYDTMSVQVQYANDVMLTYTADCYLPYEGQEIAFNGTKGRMDYLTYQGGVRDFKEIRLTPSFGRTEVITDFGPAQEKGHGGADTSLKDMVFRRIQADGLDLGAGLRAGALASLIGIAAYRSIERTGEKVRIADLVRL